MMRDSGEPLFSFEFVPPKTEEGQRNLLAAVEALKPEQFSFGPVFGLQVKGKRDEIPVCTVEHTP